MAPSVVQRGERVNAKALSQDALIVSPCDRWTKDDDQMAVGAGT
jgi:hypothetical protein